MSIDNVITFTGHMLDRPGRATPRFPESLAGFAEQDIYDWLQDKGHVLGISSLADGGDILFAENVLRRDGAMEIWLPFCLSHFAIESIQEHWYQRALNILHHPRTVILGNVNTDRPEDADIRNASYAWVNERMSEEAKKLGVLLGVKPWLLALYKYSEAGALTGGTKDAIEQWNAQHDDHPTGIIPVRSEVTTA